MAATAARTRGSSQRPRPAAGRRGLRAARLLRLRHPHADVRPAGRERVAIPRLPYHRHLLADARVPAHRTQPSQQRRGHHPGDGHGLSRLQRDGAARERIPFRDAPRRRLCDARHRQVAPHARQRIRFGGLEGTLAAVARLRALLRVHRRQDEPVGADARARQPLHRPAAPARGGVSPQRRPGRPRDRIHHRPSHRRAEQALLHVLLPRRRPRPASRRARVERALSRRVRQGLGYLARGGVRATARDGHRAGGDEALGPPAVGQGVGLAPRRHAPPLRAADGGVRRLHGADRPPHRPRRRLPRATRGARQHDRLARIRQRGIRGGRRARLVQREPVRQSRRALGRGEPEASRRLGNRAVVSRTIRGDGRGPATRRCDAGSGISTRAG